MLCGLGCGLVQLTYFKCLFWDLFVAFKKQNCSVLFFFFFVVGDLAVITCEEKLLLVIAVCYDYTPHV